MRLLIGCLFTLITAANAQPAGSAPIDYAQRSRSLFSYVLTSDQLNARLSEDTNAEIIGVRQVYIPAGRDSHTNFEVSYGTPDGTGGYSATACLALRLVDDGELGQAGPAATGVPRFAPDTETCQ